MPKDEFDFEDPFELNGMAFLTHEDTTGAMAECFIEEFLRMGYNARQVLALFRNPHYVGPNLALEKRGEPFVRNLIADVFARWGRQVTWAAMDSERGSGLRAESAGAPDSLQADSPGSCRRTAAGDMRTAGVPQEIELDAGLTDPMGAAIPKLNV